MAAKLTAADLIGRRAGRLEIVGVIVLAGKNTIVRCRCDCGRVEDYPNRRLIAAPPRGIRGCSMCEGRACAICGAIIPRSTRVTCSPECGAEAKRRYQLRYYHQRHADDPRYRANSRQRKALSYVERSDDEIARDRGRKAASDKRLRADAEWLERRRAYERDWARARRAVLKADPDAYEAWLAGQRERRREYQREWSARRMEEMTPDERAADRRNRNRLNRESARQRELESLFALAAKINERMTDGE